MFDSGLVWANDAQIPGEQHEPFYKPVAGIDKAKPDRLGGKLTSCTLESIRQKQRFYKRDVYMDVYIENLDRSAVSGSLNRSTVSNPRQVEVIDFDIVASTPHDVSAYTEGLFYHQGYLYESTGGLGISDIRKSDLATGQVINKKQLPDNYFAEGLTLAGNRLVQITLKKNLAFIYDVENFKVVDQFEFTGDGWGLVTLDNNLLISDGSSTLRTINVKDHQLLAENKVTVNGVELEGINEMENIKGMLYANIWPTDCIAIIDPAEYQVVAWLDLTGIYPEDKRLNQSSVLNGIAYEPAQDKLLVTGKNWPQVYHLKLNKYPGSL